MRAPASLCVVTAFLAACSRGAPAARRADPAEAVGSSAPAHLAAAVGDPTGRWIVISETAPGVSAMEDEERHAWRGRAVLYERDVAAVGRDTCRGPHYTSRAVDADSLLDIDFRIAPADLGLAPHGRLVLTDVTCGGATWTAPGSVLLRVSPTRAYITWGGVFFLLARQT